MGRADRVPRGRVDASAAPETDRQPGRGHASRRLRLARSLRHDRRQPRAARQQLHRAERRLAEFPFHRHHHRRRDGRRARHGRVPVGKMARDEVRLSTRMTR